MSRTEATDITATIEPLKLESEIGIEQAAALHAELKQRFEQAAPVQIDAENVQRLHTAALQLFCLFCRDRRTAGRDVEFLRPSEALRSAAALLGATTLLQLTQARA